MVDTIKTKTQKDTTVAEKQATTGTKAEPVRATAARPQTHVDAVRANTLAALCARAIVRDSINDAAGRDADIQKIGEFTGYIYPSDGSLKPLASILSDVEGNPAPVVDTAQTELVPLIPIGTDSSDSESHNEMDDFVQVEVHHSKNVEPLFIPRTLIQDGVLTGGRIKDLFDMIRCVIMPEYMLEHHPNTLIQVCNRYAREHGYKFEHEDDPINMVNTVISNGWF